MKRRSDSSHASRRYHDRVARQYDAIYDDAYWEFHDRLTWSAIKPYLPRDQSAACCDIGCGTGKWGLKLLKSGFAVTFIDHAASMIEQVRAKLDSNEKKATLLAADMVDLSAVADDSFHLILAMGDPLSICSDPTKAARQMNRICVPGGYVIATADNKFAALEHYLARNDIEQLARFIRDGRTNWLTRDKEEQFTLTTFTPTTLRKLFEKSGFEVIEVIGKTVLPLRRQKQWLENREDLHRLLELEQELSQDPSAAAVANHLQITARKPL
ncbi:MAG TPA: class I SAM-dependent methyltransferase [Tepidisphaeraceae bacterium]|nr:class I SAM-dependent methyltransferase [Tepidisphaeraceae bacterium]